MTNLRPSYSSLIRNITTNEWSDEARKAALEARRKKSGGSWLKTAGGVGLVAGGVLLGAALGGRTLPRILGKGRLAKSGESLLGKVVFTKGSSSKSYFKPSWAITLPGGRSSTSALRKAARKKGLKGKLARTAQKIDQFLAVPERHYGVGTAKGRITHFAPEGTKTVTPGKFGGYWKGGRSGKVYVASEGAVSGTRGKLRKAEIGALTERSNKRKNWKGIELRCLGDKNCETFARGIAQGGVQKRSKYLETVAKGVIGGAALGSVPGTVVLARKKKNLMTNIDPQYSSLVRKKKEIVRNRVQKIAFLINGGPGSGFYNHKGIPGQVGGSLPSGESSPSGRTNTRARSESRELSESPKARTRRIKRTYTATARLAEVFSDHANRLELKRKKKTLPLNTSELGQLVDAHGMAAKNFRDSARQATMVKGATKEEQLARLDKSDFHSKLAEGYSKRLDRKTGKGGVKGPLGKAFAYGLIGGTPEELAARLGQKVSGVGADIALGAVREGMDRAKFEGQRRIIKKSDLTIPTEARPTPSLKYKKDKPLSELGAAESLVRRMGGSPFTPGERKEYSVPIKQTTISRPSAKESISQITGAMKSGASDRARKYGKDLIAPRDYAGDAAAAKRHEKRARDMELESIKLRIMGGKQARKPSWISRKKWNSVKEDFK